MLSWLFKPSKFGIITILLPTMFDQFVQDSDQESGCKIIYLANYKDGLISDHSIK